MKTSLIAGLAALLLLSWTAPAQEADPLSGAPNGIDGDDDTQTLTVDVDLVRVWFAVTDEDGRPVRGLREQDIGVYEDGVRQAIRSFDAQTELPLTVVLAMDTSGSVRAKLEFEQEAAIEFFFTIIERRRDRGMLVTFDSTVQVLQDFTDSPELLSEALRNIRVGGSSAMYDAIYLAISQKVAQQPAGRRVMIVVSDGDDNASLKTADEALEIAQKHDVVIYTVSTNSTANFGARRQERGDRLLEDLARETGGRAFYPFELAELAESLRDITDHLRSQYVVTYASSNPLRDGAFREIEVRTVNRDYEVTARSGYYAPTE